MDIGFAPTWLRQVTSPPLASHDHFNHRRTINSRLLFEPVNNRCFCLKQANLEFT